MGFVTAMAAAPNVLTPHEWLPFLWGGEEVAPFTDGEQLESYIEAIITLWNKTRPELIEGTWVWPEACQLDDAEVVNTAARDFCEGLLQGWQIARDDWETLMMQLRSEFSRSLKKQERQKKSTSLAQIATR